MIAREMSEELAKTAYAAYRKTTEFKNHQGLPMPEWADLPDQTKEAWCNAAVAVKEQPKPSVLSPIRCFWVVEAGVIPGEPMWQYTRKFGVTVAEHESSPEITVDRMVQALEYARSLHQPQSLNWVNLQWIWC